MTKSTTQTAIHTIGLDIAKNSFVVHGFDVEGHTVLTKDLKRGQMLAWFAKLPACLVGIEACASAHYWARELLKFAVTVTAVTVTVTVTVTVHFTL
jgi:transposase